ncbi:DUF4387 domain-containing protein [Alkalibacillus aidingensis]|uniref:DUF4387 domain-containing protein n=1 Tax=Alkalibacillus aidingensis TaxID=2747607 RepID=UPI001660FB18|nr:DUF4387 domain-containing protein [Alkalibacillus aidingensis]
MKLGDLAKLIRSKNAGPFMLTIDIILKSKEHYERVINSNKITKESISELYGIEKGEIHLIHCPEINAIKISFGRLVTSGSFGDTDVFGGQQHGPLVNLNI